MERVSCKTWICCWAIWEYHWYLC